MSSKKYTEAFRDRKLSQHFVRHIHHNSRKRVRIMEVCGTHTVSIFRSGIRSLLPDKIGLCSGPGCPVCVTTQEEIDLFIMFAKQKNVIIATFGDLLRVPGTFSTLQQERSEGADVRIVYSTFDSLEIAKENPSKKVVFLGIGFETTAPTIAVAVIRAEQLKINNFFVISAHKIVLPALEAIASSDRVKVDGLILPGHVSVIIGSEAYRPFLDKYQIPCVIAGFEPIDLLRAISMLVNQINSETPKLENAYSEVVTSDGNIKAMELLNDVFKVKDSEWRGLGMIPKSGLFFRSRYASFDAQKIFSLKCEVPSNLSKPKGCDCGEILMGTKTPSQCSLYKSACTPMTPVGPCMVSSEGTCAAYYNYDHGIFTNK